MYVTANSYRWVDSLYITLFNQDLSGLGAEVLDFLLADNFSLFEHLDLFIQLTHYSIIPESNHLKHLYYNYLSPIISNSHYRQNNYSLYRSWLMAAYCLYGRLL